MFKYVKPKSVLLMQEFVTNQQLLLVIIDVQKSRLFQHVIFYTNVNEISLQR